MGEHVVLSVDSLTTPESVRSSVESSSLRIVDPPDSAIDIKEDKEQDDGARDENAPLIQIAECRICQDEDRIKNMESPCACSGSLKFAHRACVQRWCDEKGDITCEICNQAYQPGYTAPPPSQAEETAIDISGGWTIAGGPSVLNDPRLLAMAAAERRLLEADYDEYADSNMSGTAFFRSAALILMALLLLRHAISIGNGDGEDDDDVSTFFSLFLLRAAGFLLPCYIMAWAISILQRRRQRQEAAAISAAEVAFMLQAGQHRGFQVRIAPATPPATVTVATDSPPPTTTTTTNPHSETAQ